jgi:16S rRNA (guanine966-N2)-methyltransferase
MRIIGGEFKGRRFDPPADSWPTRPTTDVAKEALFNILENLYDLDNINVLDLFCGTGNHTYEFLSRGCRDITSVDLHPPAIAFVQKTLRELKMEEYVKIFRADVFQYIEGCRQQYDYIFAGPPYGMERLDALPDLIFEHDLLTDCGTFVLEHNPHHDFKDHPKVFKIRNYGQTIFSFFEKS